MTDAPNSLGPERGLGSSKTSVALALLSAPVLLTVWRYHGGPAHFDAIAGRESGGASHDLIAHVYPFASFFALAFLIPVLFLRGAWRGSWRGRGQGRAPRPLSELGLRLPTGARVVGLSLLAIPLVVLPIAWLGARMPEVRAEYPMLRALADHPEWVLPYEAAYVLLFYVAWEFYFRGYLLFTLESAYGGVTAVLVQTMASCLVHIGKPEGEILGSIPFGILAGWIALRTRSIWPTFFLHASLGVATDLFVVGAWVPGFLGP